MTQPVNFQRRALLRAAAAAAVALGSASTAIAAASTDPWDKATKIAARFKRPLVFRKQDFPITKFGAAPCDTREIDGYLGHHAEGKVRTPAEGAPDCYAAIRDAIAACHKAGGGRVLIPAGNWLVKGPIVLLSHVNVHLQAGAHVFFSNDPDDFAKYGDVDCGPNGKLVLSRWQSNDCLNYSPLIYARGQRHIALTGEDWTSILDGQGGVPQAGNGECWWDWKGKRGPGPRQQLSQANLNPNNAEHIADVAPGIKAEKARLIEGDGKKWRSDEAYLPSLSEAGVPVEKRIFGRGHYLRPCMVEFIECSKVLLAGYQLNQAPFWQHHPVACRDLEIRKFMLCPMARCASPWKTAPAGMWN